MNCRWWWRRCTDVKVSCHNPIVNIKSISIVVSELHNTVNIVCALYSATECFGRLVHAVAKFNACIYIITVLSYTDPSSFYSSSPPPPPGASGVPRGFRVFKPPPPRNSEDIGGVLNRVSKNRRFNYHLQFTVFSYGCNLLNKGFF